MKHLLAFLISFILLFCVQGFAIYEDLDGSTQEKFTVGDFADEKIAIDVTSGQTTPSGISIDATIGVDVAGKDLAIVSPNGACSDVDCGSIRIETGENTGTTRSGNISLLTGPQNTSTTESGFITIETGPATLAGSTSGQVVIRSGTSTGGAARGNVAIIGTLIGIVAITDSAGNPGKINIEHATDSTIFIGERSGPEIGGSSEAGILVKGSLAKTATSASDGSTAVNISILGVDFSLFANSTQDYDMYIGSSKSLDGANDPAKTGDVILGTGLNASATGDSGNLFITSGNATGGTSGDSGNISITSGTSTSGSRGLIKFNAPEVRNESPSGDLAIGDFATPTGASSDIGLEAINGAGNAIGLSVQTENNSTADAAATGAIHLETGNKSAGTGDSGAINLITGTSAGGTRGTAKIDSSDLTVASDILPDGDNTRRIGRVGLTYLEGFIDTITAASPLTLRSIDETSGSATGLVTIESGANAGAGDSGSIAIATGTVAGGTRGDISFAGDNADFTGMASADFTGLTITGVANDNLSNLTATAVNANILPDITDTHLLGTSSKRWANIWSTTFTSRQGTFSLNDASQTIFKITASGTTPSGSAISSALVQNAVFTNPLALYSETNSTANATATADVLIETGNKSAGTGDSGNINLQTGTSSGGARGKIVFKDGSESGAGAGAAWIQAAADGVGGWVALPATGANKTLSNLTDPTAINVNLEAASHNTIDLGKGASNFRSVFVVNLELGTNANQGHIDISDGTNANAARIGHTKNGEYALPSGTTDFFGFQNSFGGVNGNGVSLSTRTDSVADDIETPDVRLETGNKTAGTGDSGDIILLVGTSSGGDRGEISADSNLLNVSSGVATTKLTADPCGDPLAFPESTLFYNDTSDYYCFCDGAGDDKQMHSPATACFP